MEPRKGAILAGLGVLMLDRAGDSTILHAEPVVHVGDSCRVQSQVIAKGSSTKDRYP